MLLHPVFFVFYVLITLSNAQASSQAEFVEQAEAKQLGQNAYWQTLLHYAPGVLKKSSLIDDPRFFLSPEGKSDPQAELDMTLSSMFESGNLGDEHTLCRFPARSSWLIAELSIPRDQLPQTTCTEYSQLIKKIAPTSAALIFPGPHINSPASMFGHTLLTIQGQYESKLLTYAVNYSAQTDEQNGFLYAFKGIFGFYPGLYSFLPYYAKVREYGDMERRDIWEYQLNLNSDETRRLVDHVWELKDHYSDYFFFDENCSFNLLYLLEVARPGVQLTEQSRHWIIPLETIRQVEKAGLINEKTYRPSKAKRISNLLQQLSSQGKKQAFHLSHAAEIEPLSQLEIFSDDPKTLLDLAIEDLDYQYLKQKIPQGFYKRRYVSLLSQRSRFGVSKAPEFDSFAPEGGHGSARASLSLGTTENNTFTELSFRPGYHHLRDPANGYPPGAQIEYLHTIIRFNKYQQVKLEAFDLVNIFSVAPRNLFFPTTSWKIYTGARRVITKNGTRRLRYELNPGGGWAFGTPEFLWYLMGEAKVGLSEKFFGELGATSGIIHVTKKSHFSSHLSASWLADLASEYEPIMELKFEEMIPLKQNIALFVELSHLRKWGQATSTAKIGLSSYW